jgi:hypothetical protein
MQSILKGIRSVTWKYELEEETAQFHIEKNTVNINLPCRISPIIFHAETHQSYTYSYLITILNTLGWISKFAGHMVYRECRVPGS